MARFTVNIEWLRELCLFMFVEAVALPKEPFRRISKTSSALSTGTSDKLGITIPEKQVIIWISVTPYIVAKLENFVIKLLIFL